MDQVATSESAATETLVFRPRWWVGLAWAAAAIAVGAAVVYDQTAHGSPHGQAATAWRWVAVSPFAVLFAACAFAMARRPADRIIVEPLGLRLVHGRDESFHPWETIVGRRGTVGDYEYATSHGGTFALHTFTLPPRQPQQLRAAIAAHVGAQITRHQAEALGTGIPAAFPWLMRAPMLSWPIMFGVWALADVMGLGAGFLSSQGGASDLPGAATLLIPPVLLGLTLFGGIFWWDLRTWWREITFTPTHIRERWPGGRREIAYSDVVRVATRPGWFGKTRDVVVASHRRKITLNSRMDFFDGAVELLKERVPVPFTEGR
jgi:hypothetical protein